MVVHSFNVANMSGVEFGDGGLLQAYSMARFAMVIAWYSCQAACS